MDVGTDGSGDIMLIDGLLGWPVISGGSNRRWKFRASVAPTDDGMRHLVLLGKSKTKGVILAMSRAAFKLLQCSRIGVCYVGGFSWLPFGV